MCKIIFKMNCMYKLIYLIILKKENIKNIENYFFNMKKKVMIAINKNIVLMLHHFTNTISFHSNKSSSIFPNY